MQLVVVFAMIVFYTVIVLKKQRLKNQNTESSLKRCLPKK